MNITIQLKNSTNILSATLLALSVSKAIAQNDSSTSKKFLSKPLVTHIYTADPSAHVFAGKIYIYPSHDIESGKPENDNGDHFDMKDYHILSMESINGKVKDH